jgi:hypothetical protein
VGNDTRFSPGNPGRTRLLAEATKYYRMGWAVIPLRLKKPTRKWKRFQRQRPDPRTLAALFAARRDQRGRLVVPDGLAALTGPVSGGLLVRDWDDPDAYDLWAAAYRIEAAKYPTSRTGRGYQTFARCDHPIYVSHAKLGDGELIGTSQHYVALPPSAHPDGCHYRWLIPPVDLLPLVSPEAVGWLPEDLASTITIPTLSVVEWGSPEETEEESGPDLDACVEQAVRVTLPTGERQRHRCLFHLARRLRRLGFPDALACLPHVQDWHARALAVIRTRDFGVTWDDFRGHWDGYDRLKDLLPFQALALVQDDRPDLSGLPLLAEVCRVVQQMVGGRSFGLSEREAAEIIGARCHKSGRAALSALVGSGIIKLDQVGTAGDNGPNRKSSTWFYLGGVISWATTSRGHSWAPRPARQTLQRPGCRR